MAERGADGRFIKGKSGNPGGRPQGLSITALIDAAVSASDWNDIILLLRRLAMRGNMKAIEMLFDRRFGKAQQFTDLTSNGETINVHLGKADD